MAYITQDSMFARYLDVVQLNTSLQIFNILHVLSTHREGQVDVPELTLSEIYSKLKLDRGTIHKQLKRLEALGILGHGYRKWVYERMLAPTWGISPEYSALCLHVKATLEGICSEINVEKLFCATNSKGIRPSYVVAEIILTLYNQQNITVREFDNLLLGKSGNQGFKYKGKSLGESTLDNHRILLGDLDIIEHNDIREKEITYSLTKNGLDFSRYAPSDRKGTKLTDFSRKYATVVYNFLRDYRGTQRCTAEFITKELEGKLRPDNIKEGLKILVDCKAIQMQRSSAWYEPIKLTEKGRKIGEFLDSVYHSLSQ
ncbi:MAG: helix-turn-helix domain-containing protein [archaeon]